MTDKLNKQEWLIYNSRHDEALRLECLRIAQALGSSTSAIQLVCDAELLRNYIRLGTPYPPCFDKAKAE